jgi:hypothetical protein
MPALILLLAISTYANAQTKQPGEEKYGGRIIPYYSAGKLIGYRLYAIQPNGLCAKRGLANGTVVTAIIEKEPKLNESVTEIRDWENTERKFDIGDFCDSEKSARLIVEGSVR